MIRWPMSLQQFAGCVSEHEQSRQEALTSPDSFFPIDEVQMMSGHISTAAVSCFTRSMRFHLMVGLNTTNPGGFVGFTNNAVNKHKQSPTLAFCGNYFRKSKSCDQLMWTNMPVIRSSWQNENTKDKIKAYFSIRQEKRFKTGNLFFRSLCRKQTSTFIFYLYKLDNLSSEAFKRRLLWRYKFQGEIKPLLKSWHVSFFPSLPSIYLSHTHTWKWSHILICLSLSFLTQPPLFQQPTPHKVKSASQSSSLTGLSLSTCVPLRTRRWKVIVGKRNEMYLFDLTCGLPRLCPSQLEA